jgi:pyridoxamine 5'-phosphate oxidase
MLKTLTESSVKSNAFNQFDAWWQDAMKSGIDEVNALTLATASVTGKPSARIVLLKGYDENGLVFFSNYKSKKGKELADNPQACMVFFWKELERQIRVEGIVEKITEQQSDIYFLSRPHNSQLAAWASPQSSVIKSRKIIEQNIHTFEAEFANKQLSRPPHWGGYKLRPQLFEFWQGRPSRLHDRLQYTLQTGGDWKIERLAP